jgi:catechol 2,3-dioxygenase-like lactoylglutathione lyase family enzyme
MRVHHLAFRTKDLARLEAFYVGVLGFAVRERKGARSVWLDAEGVIVMLERAEEGEPEVAERSMELVAFAVEAGGLASWEKRLATKGVTIEARTNFTLYVRDPDGRRVGLSCY